MDRPAKGNHVCLYRAGDAAIILRLLFLRMGKISGYFFHHAAILVSFTIVNSQLVVTQGTRLYPRSYLRSNDHFFFLNGIFKIAGQL
jgi:hypothetical protein